MNREGPRADHRMTRNTMALILAGGRGSRLMGMTHWRSKPAVPFAGKFKIIDFPLSNCLNSGIRRIGVLTQYKAHTLILHIQKGWGFLRGEFNEFVELLPAQQRVSEDSWYEGTADAVYQNLDIIRNHNPEYILVLAGDHVYKMDYGGIIAFHWASGADVTVGCIEVPLAEASAFGVMAVDEEQRQRKLGRMFQRPLAGLQHPHRQADRNLVVDKRITGVRADHFGITRQAVERQPVRHLHARLEPVHHLRQGDLRGRQWIRHADGRAGRDHARDARLAT